MRWAFAACLTAVLVWSHAFAADGGSGGRVRDPEVWMCHRNPFDLFASGASTAFVRRRLSGIKLYIGTLRKAPSDRLAALARALRRSGVKVAVECGGTLGFAPLDDTSGEESARIELRKIDRFCRAGGRPTRYILRSWCPRSWYPKRLHVP